ncbi:MAG: hypothetical protein ACO1QR_00650 [Chthoniobacteraceae bacterium]
MSRISLFCSGAWVMLSLLAPCGALAAAADHQPRMSFVDNGTIKLGVDLNLGGAVTYLSRSHEEQNVINSWDWGRQVQMSYYSGPVPFTPNGKQPAPMWRGLGWNPIQAGDHFGNASKSIAHTNDGTTIYVKSIPMQWPLNNEPLEGTFETWYTLDGPAVKVRARLNNARSDTTQWPGRTQEMPAVYVNGPFHRLMTYTGEQPFADGELAKIDHPFGKGGTPWAHWLGTEGWAALINDDGWGVGVWNPACLRFNGGFVDKPGKGGPRDNATGYISPIRDEILDHNIQHEYEYTLIVGDLKTIRGHVYAKAKRPEPPHYEFAKDRQGWRYANATDSGWPIQGELNVKLTAGDPHLVGPRQFWKAEEAPVLYIRAALKSEHTAAQVFWYCGNESAPKSMDVPMIGDGEYRTYPVPLHESPDYRGAITGLRFDPAPAGKEGDWVKIRSISFRKPAE